MNRSELIAGITGCFGVPESAFAGMKRQEVQAWSVRSLSLVQRYQLSKYVRGQYCYGNRRG